MKSRFTTILFLISCIIFSLKTECKPSRQHRRHVAVRTRTMDEKRWGHRSARNSLMSMMDASKEVADEGIADIVDNAESGQSFEQITGELEETAEEQADQRQEAEQEDSEQQEADYAKQHAEPESTHENLDQKNGDNKQEKSILDEEVFEAATSDVSKPALQDDVNDPDAVNLQAKRETVMALIEKGEKYLKEHQPYEAFNKFTHGNDFVKGEIYLFVLDRDGTWLAHGQRGDLIWHNAINMRDTFGSPFVKVMIKTAQRGGGWVTYQWRNATKLSYVKEVNKNGRAFIIGAGYYPHSKADAVISLVKGAVAMFKQAMKNGRRKEEAFSTLSYPLGRFVFGDLYLYALDFSGIHMAHGDRPGLIGTNALGYRDSTGKFVNKEIIAKLKDGSDGVWIEYISKNAPKRTYAEKITDREGREYFIACGYYPDADRRQLVELVRRGYEYMKGHGESMAARQFTDKKVMSFRYGDLYLIVFDMKGKVIANGGNPDFVGQNFYDVKDQDGRYYVREILEKAKKKRVKAGTGEARGGWVNYKIKNSFVSAFVKPIRLGLKEYVITSGLFPITKKETAVLLARSGAGYLRTETEKVAFAAFTEVNGKFIQGDLSVFAYAFNGICLAHGDDDSFIWRNMLDAKDDKNMPYVQVFINTVRQGAGKVTYTINGVQRVVFIERVDKGDRSYVVGSGYFK